MRKNSHNKSQWQRTTDNTRLRPQRWQKINEEKDRKKQKSMTESDWQHKGDKNNQKNGLTHRTIINDTEWLTTQDWDHKSDRERVRKKDAQNKSPQRWQKNNEKKWFTKQESMTENVWQHKIETTKVTENESGKRIDRTIFNDTEWLTTQDWAHKGDREWMREKTQTKQESITENDWQTQDWDHQGDRQIMRKKDSKVNDRETLTRQDWAHKGERELMRKTDRQKTRISDREWVRKQDWDHNGDKERMRKKDSQNKSQWHRVIDNTKLRPQEWQKINKDKWQTKTRINDREWLTTQGRQRKWEKWIDNTRVNDTEGLTTQDIETTRVTETESGKKDWQNKRLWQRLSDNTRLRPQRWQRINEEKWQTKQELMTESDWQHKGHREKWEKWTDRTRVNDTEVLTTQDIETTRVTEKNVSEKGLTEEESMTREWLRTQAWDHKGDRELVRKKDWQLNKSQSQRVTR